jgi:hypothetical protein
MNTKKQENILHKYIEKIKKGELSKEEVLGYLKTHDKALHDLLKKALLFEEFSLAAPSPEYKTASKNRIFYNLMQEIEAAQPPQREPLRNLFNEWRPRLQPFLTVALVLIISFGGLVGVAQAADSAVPGDFLYPVDKAIENIRLALTIDEKARVRLLLENSQERIEEANLLFSQGKYELGNVALAEYEQVMVRVSQIIQTADADIQAELQNMVAAYTAENTTVLTNLLDMLPASAADAVEHAIELLDTPSGLVETEEPTTGDDDLAGDDDTADDDDDLAGDDDDADDEGGDDDDNDDVTDDDKDNQGKAEEVLATVDAAKATKDAEKEDKKATKEAEQATKDAEKEEDKADKDQD